MPEPTTTTIWTPRDEIPVAVVRKRVKNLNLRVRTDGSVVLSIPQHVGMARAEAFVARKEPWIAEHVRRRTTAAKDHDSSASGQGCGSGSAWERHHLWGEPVDAGTLAGSDLAEIQRREVARALPAVAARFESAMGVSASRWSIRHMKTRWGSCTPAARAIRINARLAAYPLECLEFVVAHELAHLIEPNHGMRFHMLLDAYYPPNREVGALLRRLSRSGDDDCPNSSGGPESSSGGTKDR